MPTSDRSLIGSIHMNKRLTGMTGEERTDMTADVNAAWPRKFEDQVDPERKLPKDEHPRRAMYARASRSRRRAGGRLPAGVETVEDRRTGPKMGFCVSATSRPGPWPPELSFHSCRSAP